MCGPIGGCGGAARNPGLQAQLDAGLQQLSDMGVEAPTQGGGSAHQAHSSTQAGAAAVTLGQTYGAWGTNAKFAVVSSSTEQHHGSEHEKVILQRTTADDSVRARRILQSSINLFGNATIAPGGKTHVKLTAEQKSQWKQANPGMPEPNQLVYDGRTGRAVGLLFVGGERAKDLGMGQLHQHEAGGAIMQHIWFTPNDLGLAFGDAAVKQQAIQAALAR